MRQRVDCRKFAKRVDCRKFANFFPCSHFFILTMSASQEQQPSSPLADAESVNAHRVFDEQHLRVTSELPERDPRIQPLMSTGELLEYNKRCHEAIKEVDELVEYLNQVKERMEQVVERGVLLQDIWRCAQMQRAEEEEANKKRKL